MNKLLALCLLAFSLSATAEIYKWTDAEGRVHFGDKPSEGSKPQALTAPRPGNSYPGGSIPGAPVGDARERQRRLMDAIQQENAERERKAQQQAAEKAALGRQCQEVRDTLQAIDGRPAYITGANGEQQFLDEAQRKDYIDQANTLLKERCE
jgi:hypothetical protein